MQMIKRLTAITLCIALLALCGCGAVAGPQTAAPASDTPAAAASTSAPVKTADGTVTVSTVDELLAAIAPDTTVVLASGLYDLSKAADYGKTGGEYYSWVESYDGPELSLNGVSGLTLKAAEDAEVTISAVPRYADVLYFDSCSNIVLEDLTLGHTQEPGQCAGGVLNFDNCENVLINDCELFGCGIMGVQAAHCRTLHVTDSHIYDCSYGAAYIESCRDVLFDDCEIDDCSTYNALFEFVSSSQCAVINSEVSRCTAPRLLLSSYSSGIYMGAVDVEQNSFEQCMFTVIGKPVTLEGCYLLDNVCTYWYGPRYDGTEDSVPCVSPDGAELDVKALSAMKLSDDVSWSAKPEEKPAVAAPTVSEDGAVHVSSVDELLSAIAPNAKIYLEDGVYDLSAAANYGNYVGDWYCWTQTYDGPALNITDVDGLTLMAGGPDKATVSAVPRYVDVISFLGCDDLTLSGFTAGHTQEPGACAGGVLYFSDCDRARIENCSLFGCGILGIAADSSEDMTVTGTEIYDCSQGAVNVNDCPGLSFENCDIHDCATPELYFNNPGTVKYNGAELNNGAYRLEDGNPVEWTAVDELGRRMAENLELPLAELVICTRNDTAEGFNYSPAFLDITVLAGVDSVTLCLYDTTTGLILTDVKWSVTDDAALSLVSNADGSCTVSAVTSAAKLTAESGGKSCTIDVFCAQ